ncbi:response regulator [Ilyomonas limi]|uniref:Response regulator n=1 Tax=Ilyomonas limi TaxID=2575867 RepID=A0A4U3KRM7_9BACT|nr:response regulator [Ilyomonas limi]TKK64279.1 response regulator [Ilyomonas limi]
MNSNFTELLIIDDDCCHNILCALALKKIFRTSNVNMTCFTNSEEGLAYIMQSAMSSKKTLLFIDVNMPRLNGWQILARLEQLPKTLTKHLDVYILTTTPNMRDEYRALKSSLVKQYLQKPISNHLHSIFAGQPLQLSVA